MQSMTNLHIRITAIALMLGASGLTQAQTLSPPVRVQVYGTHEGGNIVYHYKVLNNSNSGVALNNFVIGSIFDSNLGDEMPQLERPPLGWEWASDGDSIILAPTSTRQPAYWASKFCSPFQI